MLHSLQFLPKNIEELDLFTSPYICYWEPPWKKDTRSHHVTASNLVCHQHTLVDEWSPTASMLCSPAQSSPQKNRTREVAVMLKTKLKKAHLQIIPGYWWLFWTQHSLRPLTVWSGRKKVLFYGTVNATHLAILTAIALCHGYHVIFRLSAHSESLMMEVKFGQWLSGRCMQRLLYMQAFPGSSLGAYSVFLLFYELCFFSIGVLFRI